LEKEVLRAGVERLEKSPRAMRSRITFSRLPGIRPGFVSAADETGRLKRPFCAFSMKG
jgi:hypothetical protein